MKTFVCNHRGYEIWLWTTGKYEAYDNGKATAYSGRTLGDVIGQIDDGKDKK